jgi:hypothetical protein
MYARLYVEQLTVNHQTPNDDRDEVFFIVAGARKTAGVTEQVVTPRVPIPPHTYHDDDYYGLHAGGVARDDEERTAQPNDPLAELRL